jgi:hypothetical protein
MMRIKGHRVFDKKPKASKKSSLEIDLGQSEIENELFEQSLTKSRQTSKEMFLNGQSNENKEDTGKNGFNGKSTLLPEDIQEILFNNNQVYVDKPLKEINKLFRDLKQARKMDKIYKNEDGNILSQTIKPENNITGIIDNFADQVESCFNDIQAKQNPDKQSILALKSKLHSFFCELKQVANKNGPVIKPNKIISESNDEKEIKSLTHILDGSLENLINGDKEGAWREREKCTNLTWGSARVGSLFDKMAINERVYHELGNIKKFNFKLKEALSTYQRKKK